MMIIFLFFLSFIFLVGESHSIEPRAWISAAKSSGMKPSELYGVALKESGTTLGGKIAYQPWPWTLNVNGKGKHYETRAEAVVALRTALAMGTKNIDVGMMQINLKWNGHLVPDPFELFDPEVSISAATKVINDCKTRFIDTKTVLSCYNRGKVDITGLEYAEKVTELAYRWISHEYPSELMKIKKNKGLTRERNSSDDFYLSIIAAHSKSGRKRVISF